MLRDGNHSYTHKNPQPSSKVINFLMEKVQLVSSIVKSSCAFKGRVKRICMKSSCVTIKIMTSSEAGEEKVKQDRGGRRTRVVKMRHITCNNIDTNEALSAL